MARLQNEVGTKYFFRDTNFLTNNAPKFSPKMFEPLVSGSEKHPPNFPPKLKKKHLWRASAEAPGERAQIIGLLMLFVLLLALSPTLPQCLQEVSPMDLVSIQYLWGKGSGDLHKTVGEVRLVAIGHGWSCTERYGFGREKLAAELCQSRTFEHEFQALVVPSLC